MAVEPLLALTYAVEMTTLEVTQSTRHLVGALRRDAEAEAERDLSRS